MKDINSNMDKIFRDKLSNYQQQPPEGLWAGIKAGMGNNSRHKILIPLWQAAAGAALIVAVGSLFYFLNRPVQNLVAEKSFPAPENILVPDRPLVSGSAGAKVETAASEPAGKKQPSIHSTQESKKEFVPGHAPIKSESKFISDKLPGEFLQIKSLDFNLQASIPLALMPKAYLPPVQKDKIPQNNKTFIASWDMLDTPADLIADADTPDRLFLTAQVSPTYSYRDIGNAGTSQTQQFNKYESGRINYSGGLQFGYKTSDRLSIHTGLMYAQLGYNINQVEIYKGNAISTGSIIVSMDEGSNPVYAAKNSIGTISTASGDGKLAETGDGNYNNVTSVVPSIIETGGKIEQYFQYLELPFLLRYRIIDRKIGVNLLGGLSTNILVGNHTSLIINGETSKLGASQNIKNFNYMGNLGLGFDYLLRKNLLFTVEPQFKYFLNSINDNHLVNRPYMLGMFTGIRFMW